MSDDLFTVIGRGTYIPEGDLFLPDIDPEDAVGWPEARREDFEEAVYDHEILPRLEAAYGITHFEYDYE